MTLDDSEDERWAGFMQGADYPIIDERADVLSVALDQVNVTSQMAVLVGAVIVLPVAALGQSGISRLILVAAACVCAVWAIGYWRWSRRNIFGELDLGGFHFAHGRSQTWSGRWAHVRSVSLVDLSEQRGRGLGAPTGQMLAVWFFDGSLVHVPAEPAAIGPEKLGRMMNRYLRRHRRAVEVSLAQESPGSSEASDERPDHPGGQE